MVLAGRRTAVAFLLAVPAGLALTLASPGLDSVHRWTHLGPFQLNVAEIFAPPALVGLSMLGGSLRWPWVVAAVAMALLITQPDASQATALGGGIMAVVAFRASGQAFRWAAGALIAAAIICAWLRPDPLPPVPEVEQILRLAWDLSPLAAVLTGALIGAAAVAPGVALRTGAPSTNGAALGLVAYFLLSAITPAIGAFPVPLAGMATSPILGFWLGVGMLAAQMMARNAPSPAP